MRQITINFSKERVRNRGKKIADIKTSLKQCEENCSAHPSPENIERLENLKAEYNHIFQHISKGAMIRSRATWYEKIKGE